MWCSRNDPSKTTKRRKRQQIWDAAPTPVDALEPRLLMAAEVLTYHNDNQRTGENLSETILTPANVNASDFGKVGQLPVDGAVYAQPLYKANLPIPGRGRHNVLFVATEHDSVYAFDADNFALLWHDSFINPAKGVTPVPAADVQSDVIFPEIGITSTPVIDPTMNTLYVVDMTKDVSTGSPRYFQHLHALDLATGAEKFRGPAVIGAAVSGFAPENFKGQDYFDPSIHLQRTGLLLLDGVVYITWASFGDNGPYHGWVMGYSARGLKQVSVLNVTPDGFAGGIWMGGGAPASDTRHNIYLATGNGTFNANAKGRNYGDTVLKLSARNRLAVTDYITPANQALLRDADLDLGSGGVLVLPDQPGPHPHLLVASGKDGTMYLLNRDFMGRFATKGDVVLQKIDNTTPTTYGTPAYFNGTVYFVVSPRIPTAQSVGGPVLIAYHIVNGLLIPSATAGNFPYGYPGSSPAISANGTVNGIVWTLDNGGSFISGPSILRAYDANNLSNELYDSTQAGARDQAGPAVKFTMPTVVNGKVYVGGKGVVTVYGLSANLSH